ncbi:stAR-related lipid transfer protein 7, mitochondrial isoform X1 [Lingula anatina]|uniref:Phosphatidylcholine transfer protein n=1 Tax=Lingula anatina TaxID=7574 RepID=A0A1S3JEX1_LINAN|nr:stAR-related lipid transfer protein 7, mitochondrial isoform X1 [Lingula anatina]|eukprot:XP_013408439.1 stAR-related lipid transfer protein 7, mitochondrial isoform X1 [Lingula anatina]
MFRNILRPEIVIDIGKCSRKFAQNERSKTSTFLGACRSLVNRCSQELEVIGGIFVKQCNAVVIHRAKRGCQILTSYNRLYDEKLAKEVMKNFVRNLKKRGRRGILMSGAGFAAKQNISDDELLNCVADMHHIENLNEYTRKQKSSSKDKISETNNTGNGNGNDSHYMDDWECVIDKDTFKIWRKQMADSHLYEYKVFGRFYDIPATAFLDVQIDLEFRKTWDKMVINLEKVEEDKESNNEIVHWVTRYPYPMYAREYVYRRRFKVFEEEKVIVLVSRSTDHEKCPETKDYIRVKPYSSGMVIKPHTEFDQNGLDYLMTYHDDPQAPIPSVAYKWIARSGLPDFVERLHKEAKNYQDKCKGRKKPKTGRIHKEVDIQQYNSAHPLAA